MNLALYRDGTGTGASHARWTCSHSGATCLGGCATNTGLLSVILLVEFPMGLFVTHVDME